MLAQTPDKQERGTFEFYPSEVDPPTSEDVEMLFFAQDNHDLTVYSELHSILEDNPFNKYSVEVC